MVRPVQINRSDALVKVRDEFWSRGYSATSMSTLLAATDMGAGSFYAAFGSKREAFTKALETYAAQTIAQLRALRESHPGLSALSMFLDLTVFDVDEQVRSRGCLVVKTVAELRNSEPELHKFAMTLAADFKAELNNILADAEEHGQLDPRLSPTQATDLVFTFLNGLRVECGANSCAVSLRHKSDTLIQLLSQFNLNDVSDSVSNSISSSEPNTSNS